MVLLSLVICMGVTTNAWAEPGNDTTAPLVEGAVFTTTTVDKPAEDGITNNIELNLSVIEEATGIKSIQVSIYSYVEGNSSPILIFADKNFEEGVYTGNITIDIPVSRSNAAGIYRLGSIEIVDNAGNTTRYFDHYNSAGYKKDAQDRDYLKCYGENDETNGCYIDANGATVQINSNGDDTAPIVTEATVINSSITRPGTIELKLDVIEESGIESVEVTYTGKKDGQDIMISFFPVEYDVVGNVVTVYMPVSETDTAGKYYVSDIRITDTQGNNRKYTFDYSTYTYYVEDEEMYIQDTGNENFKCYIKDGATVTVESSGDDTAPIINKITLDKHTVVKPGVLNMTLDLTEADEVKQVGVYLRKCNGTEQDWINYYAKYDEKKKSDRVVVNFPIATATEGGEYYIERIEINDYSGNKREYALFDYENGYSTEGDKAYIADNNDSNIKAYLEKNQTIMLEDEFEVDFEVALSNQNLLSLINDMPEGETGKIYIDGEGIAKAQIFEAIKGKDKTVIFYKDNYQWVFNGKDVTEPKDINLEVTFEMVNGGEYGVDGNLLKIVFPENGVLPGKTNVRIKSDYTYQLYEVTETMYLYYLNEDALEYQEGSDIAYLLDGTDHWCKFDITHNSVYMVSNEKIENDTTDTDDKEDGSDDNKEDITDNDKEDITGDEDMSDDETDDDSDDENVDGDTEEDSSDDDSNKDEVPDTGDNSSVGICVVLLVGSILSVVCFGRKRRHI